MKRNIPSVYFLIVVVALLVLSSTGCAFRVVRPQPLVVGSAESGNQRVVEYPAYVLVHDSESFWDAHQIKDNLFGLTEVSIVHIFDLGIDAATPGPKHRPLENGIEWIKNHYAQLPDCAPVRIVGGFFYALGMEKTTLIAGANTTILSPTDPTLIYLTNWVQETLGELNTAGGYIVPWSGPFIPRPATAPVNRCVDWTQAGAIGLYIYIVNKVNIGLDSTISGCESAWGGVVGWFVW
jgi:hypothetical protein